MMPLFSVILVNYNGKDFVLDCIASILESSYPDFEIILVDNASCDNSLELVRQKFSGEERLKIIGNSSNLHFVEANNIGIRNSKGDFIILLNNDTQVKSDWLNQIEIAMRDVSIGACQPKVLCYEDQGVIDNAGNYLDSLGYAHGRGHLEADNGQYESMEETFFAAGTAMVLRGKVLKGAGFLDSKFLMYSEDVDISWRIRLKGYRIVYVPKAVVYHKGSRTIAKFSNRIFTARLSRRNRLAVLIKNYGCLRLLGTLPQALFFYVLVFFKEMLIDRNPKLAFTSLSAIFWNIKELPYLLKARRFAQEIRVVPDRKITKYMHHKSILIEQYLKPFIYGNIS